LRLLKLDTGYLLLLDLMTRAGPSSLFFIFIFETSVCSIDRLGLLRHPNEAPKPVLVLLNSLRFPLFVNLFTHIAYSFAGVTACVCSPLQTLLLRQPLPIRP
jgi:hypothetical protein